MYYRARYYQPSMGRFTTLDQLPGRIREPATQQGYSYARNSPPNFIDPSGAVATPMGAAFELIRLPCDAAQSLGIDRLSCKVIQSSLLVVLQALLRDVKSRWWGLVWYLAYIVSVITLVDVATSVGSIVNEALAKLKVPSLRGTLRETLYWVVWGWVFLSSFLLFRSAIGLGGTATTVLNLYIKVTFVFAAARVLPQLLVGTINITGRSVEELLRLGL